MQETERFLDVPAAHQDMNVFLQHFNTDLSYRFFMHNNEYRDEGKREIALIDKYTNSY